MPFLASPRFFTTAFLAGLLVAAGPATAATDARARQVIQDFLAAYQAVQTFEGRVRTETRKGGQAQITRSQLWLKKPHFTALKIVEAPQTRAAEGTKLVWFGEPTVQVKTRFFGFPVQATPRFDDPRLAGLRGWNMRELSIVAAVALAQDARSRFTYVGPATFLGRPMTVIEARGPRLLPGTDRQLMWIDDRHKLPFVMEMYDGPERAFRIEVEKFAFDGKLPVNTFKLD